MNLSKEVAHTDKHHCLLVALIVISTFLLQACGDGGSENIASLESYKLQGTTYLEQKQFKATITAAKKAIKNYPESIDGYLLLAQVYSQLEQPELTITTLLTYKGRKNSEYYFLLSSAYKSNQQLEKANYLLATQSQYFVENEAHFILEKAELSLLHNDLKSASQLYKSLQENPNYSVDSALGRAKLMIAYGEVEHAMRLLDEVMIDAPKKSESYLLKSKLLIERKEFEKAEELLTQALSVMPSSDLFTPEKVKVLAMLSEALIVQKRSSESLFYARVFAKEHPENFLVDQYYQKALIDYQSGDFSDAKTSLEKSLSIAPEKEKLLTLFSAVLYQLGEAEMAKKYIARIDFSNKAKLLSDNFNQVELRSPEKVIELLTSTITSEQQPDILGLYLLSSLQSKQYSESEKVLNKIVKNSDSSASALLQQSYYYANKELPDLGKVLTLLKGGLKKFPLDYQVKASYLEVLLQLGKANEAELYVMQLVESASDDVNAQLLIGEYYLYQKQYLLANQYFEQVLALYPNKQEALFSLANCFHLSQKYSQAVKVYLHIIKLAPQQFEAYQGSVNSFAKTSKQPGKLHFLLPDKHDPALLALALVDMQIQQYKLQTADGQLQIAFEHAPSYLQAYAQKLKLGKDYQQALQATASSNFEGARQLILDNLKISASSEAFLMLLVKVEIKSENYNEAKKILMQLTTILPNNPLLDIYQADLAIEQNQPEQALALLQVNWQKTHNEKVAMKLYQLLKSQDDKKALQFLKQWQSEMPDSKLLKLAKS